MTLYISLLYNTTPIHCTPDPLHPPLQSIHSATTPFVLTPSGSCRLPRPARLIVCACPACSATPAYLAPYLHYLYCYCYCYYQCCYYSCYFLIIYIYIYILGVSIYHHYSCYYYSYYFHCRGSARGPHGVLRRVALTVI